MCFPPNTYVPNHRNRNVLEFDSVQTVPNHGIVWQSLASFAHWFVDRLPVCQKQFAQLVLVWSFSIGPNRSQFYVAHIRVVVLPKIIHNSKIQHGDINRMNTRTNRQYVACIKSMTLQAKIYFNNTGQMCSFRFHIFNIIWEIQKFFPCWTKNHYSWYLWATLFWWHCYCWLSVEILRYLIFMLFWNLLLLCWFFFSQLILLNTNLHTITDEMGIVYAHYHL